MHSVVERTTLRIQGVGAILATSRMSARESSSPTPSNASNAELDCVLGIQITIAWAGETISGEERLAWWRTELTDPAAGGDFLSRLLPRSHAWAGLVAVREAARRVDEAKRRRIGTPDAIWSLFHFGFAWASGSTRALPSIVAAMRPRVTC